MENATAFILDNRDLTSEKVVANGRSVHKARILAFQNASARCNTRKDPEGWTPLTAKAERVVVHSGSPPLPLSPNTPPPGNRPGSFPVRISGHGGANVYPPPVQMSAHPDSRFQPPLARVVEVKERNKQTPQTVENFIAALTVVVGLRALGKDTVWGKV